MHTSKFLAVHQKIQQLTNKIKSVRFCQEAEICVTLII